MTYTTRHILCLVLLFALVLGAQRLTRDGVLIAFLPGAYVASELLLRGKPRPLYIYYVVVPTFAMVTGVALCIALDYLSNPRSPDTRFPLHLYVYGLVCIATWSLCLATIYAVIRRVCYDRGVGGVKKL